VDIRSRANTTMGLNFDHKIKASAHKGDMRIGKTPKKLASICCPQRRETKADTLKATEANRRRGLGTSLVEITAHRFVLHYSVINKRKITVFYTNLE
jgi:hypothetical protein